MNRITLLKLIDRTVGKALTCLIPRMMECRREMQRNPGDILFIRPGGIGDAVLLLPAITKLKKKFPDSHIDVLCEKRNAGVFDLVKDINKVYLYDKGFEIFTCIKNKYDVVIDTEQWHRLSAVVAYLTKAPVRIGFNTNERGKLLTHKILYSHDDYEVYSFLRLIKPITVTPQEFAVDSPFIDIDQDKSFHLSEGFAEKDDVVIAIFPGASIKERKWGSAKFGKVAGVLSSKGYKIIILGSGGDRREADEIKKLAPAALDLTGRTSLVAVAAVLKKCRLLITADSGLMHLAYAVGTSTVSLFGSGIEKKWAPQGGSHVVINKRFDCSPCTMFGYTPRCVSGAVCLSAITAEEVLAAVEQILS